MAKATGPKYNVPFRRSREGMTNYYKRESLVKFPVRMVVRKSNAHIRVQFVKFDAKGDVVLACATSEELRKFGWSPHANLPTAYLTGLLAGKRAKKAGVGDVVLDIGLHTPTKGAGVFTAAKGAIDAGVGVRMGEGLLDEARVRGEHISEYAKKLKGTPAYEKCFSAYVKSGVAPESIPDIFDSAKGKIMSEG